MTPGSILLAVLFSGGTGVVFWILAGPKGLEAESDRSAEVRIA